MREFHISKKMRDLLRFDRQLYSLSGNIVFADLSATKNFVYEYNEKTKKNLKPGHVFTVGVIVEVLHYVISLYRKDVKETVFEELYHFLVEKLGKTVIEHLFSLFVREFPPSPVYLGDITEKEYLEGLKIDPKKRELILEEILVLWLENINPAFSFLSDFISDEILKRESEYLKVIKETKDFFDNQEPFGPLKQNLLQMLLSPIDHEPHSLDGQIGYIVKNWGYLLGDLLLKLKKGSDSVKEEKVFFFLEPKKHDVYDYTHLLEEAELIPEPEWMESLVLVAKHTHVWLYQLSKKYGRPIERVDQIPEEELLLMRERGINGIWLIGIWERSIASKMIKNLCGNKEAIASAYSIYDYVVAKDLGGESAYEDLKRKAEKYGIRLGCDMVPNHMGIYSKWMVEKPKWFIYRYDNPYPWYRFSLHNLSLDPGLEIFIEDHYYDRTDAAVVCKRVDKATGEVVYIYHGNDGTGMPWNDTIQLNYLIPDVRDAVLGLIVEIAKKFPIIRFDAAMTLTKMHYQRLWFPEPGKGGAIPTRAEFAMTKEEFDKYMPSEFWKDVVKKVKEESPETLLIAEAFWLLEGFFIKELGMDRVYNSAFMNMLRDEENAKYRQIIKNTLKFDPEILKRFVNFMTNPDEKTAYEQFGLNDKYFGVCTMMVSLPGLPMFGHGQIEGFKEKYGMEFKRPYLDEEENEAFVKRHEREIFFILKNRQLFSSTKNFFFYDFVKDDGSIDEDVFVYSNSRGDKTALVIYHNKNKVTSGWIRSSVPKKVKKTSGKVDLLKVKISDALGISKRKGLYTVLRDERKNLEYRYSTEELINKGLHIRLGPYECLVFTDIGHS
ncbi:MAG: alpha-amylase family glycosyl hydrolase [Deltaproteobacteria bacterium]|nr:alpha-amylase family glycosyl hydrolase [Deltaproteobacteria bacterium]